MANVYRVRKDNTIEVMKDATDADIWDVYESLSAHVVFRIIDDVVEYAEPDPRTEGIIWKKAQRV